jgi:hypothetical protein
MRRRLVTLLASFAHHPHRDPTITIVLKAGMAAASTIAIGISAQSISVALLDTEAGGPSRSGVRTVMTQAIIVANTATAIAADSQTTTSTPFTGRTPPIG